MKTIHEEEGYAPTTTKIVNGAVSTPITPDSQQPTQPQQQPRNRRSYPEVAAHHFKKILPGQPSSKKVLSKRPER